MSDIHTSELMQQRAADALTQGTVLKTGNGFVVYALPAGFMDHLALLLWEEGKDFSPSAVPRDFLLPVPLEGRQGYLWGKDAALAFNG